MSVLEMGAQTSRRHGWLQAGRTAVLGCVALACLGPLDGCSSLNPANLFHREEGGTIAQPHAAPPGAGQPYPNLATVPENPPVPDMAALEHISNGLISDRANAQHVASASPLADPSLPAASPALFGVGTRYAAGAGIGSAAADRPIGGVGKPSGSHCCPGRFRCRVGSDPAAKPAATAPTPQKAPVATVESAPLPAPAATAPIATARSTAPLRRPRLRRHRRRSRPFRQLPLQVRVSLGSARRLAMCRPVPEAGRSAPGFRRRRRLLRRRRRLRCLPPVFRRFHRPPKPRRFRLSRLLLPRNRRPTQRPWWRSSSRREPRRFRLLRCRRSRRWPASGATG